MFLPRDIQQLSACRSIQERLPPGPDLSTWQWRARSVSCTSTALIKFFLINFFPDLVLVYFLRRVDKRISRNQQQSTGVSRGSGTNSLSVSQSWCRNGPSALLPRFCLRIKERSAWCRSGPSALPPRFCLRKKERSAWCLDLDIVR